MGGIGSAIFGPAFGPTVEESRIHIDLVQTNAGEYRFECWPAVGIREGGRREYTATSENLLETIGTAIAVAKMTEE